MFVLAVIGVLALLGAMTFYYHKLAGRICAALGHTPKYKYILWLASLALAVCTVNIFSALGIFLLYFICLCLILDLVKSLTKRLTKDNEPKLWIKLWQLSVIPAGIALVALVYGFFNIHNYIRTDYDIKTPKPMDQSYRILMISDSHYGKVLKSDELNELKEEFDNVDADLVLLVGDIVDENTTKEEMEEIFSLFGNIRNKYGVYYVYGNHDRQPYTSQPTFTVDELDQAMLRSGITILSDTSTRVEEDITLVGREDYGQISRAELGELMYGVNHGDFIIMMDHQPLEYEENAALGVDLIVSGHTHAGQVWPLGYFIQLFHTADLWYGYEQVDDMQAIVSSGLVGWGYPIRTQKHSEYVVINLSN